MDLYLLTLFYIFLCKCFTMTTIIRGEKKQFPFKKKEQWTTSQLTWFNNIDLNGQTYYSSLSIIQKCPLNNAMDLKIQTKENQGGSSSGRKEPTITHVAGSSPHESFYHFFIP